MEFDEITYAARDGVGEITLSRPDRLNPISARPGGTRDQLLLALSEAESDSDVGCVLLTGAGRAFSAGGDLTGNESRETPFEQQAFIEAAETFHRRWRAARIPVVAAVNGICLGAALSLVACCDFVLAGEAARFGLPEGRMGLVGAGPLVPLIGRQWAKFLILSGEMIDARRACEIGLVLTVEPDDALRARASELCARLARLPREAVLLNKRHIDAVADASGDAAGRVAGAAHDALTLANSARATAPDGRTFREIIGAEGVDGLKRARSSQYDGPWLH